MSSTRWSRGATIAVFACFLTLGGIASAANSERPEKSSFLAQTADAAQKSYTEAREAYDSFNTRMKKAFGFNLTDVWLFILGILKGIVRVIRWIMRQELKVLKWIWGIMKDALSF